MIDRVELLEKQNRLFAMNRRVDSTYVTTKWQAVEVRYDLCCQVACRQSSQGHIRFNRSMPQNGQRVAKTNESILIRDHSSQLEVTQQQQAGCQ